MTVITWCAEHGKDLLQLLGAAVALATLAVKLTPTQKDDAFLAAAVKVLSALSLCNADGSFIGGKDNK